MKKVIVTGAAGFIGSHVCRRLVDDGYDVTAIDNLEPFNSPPACSKEEKLANIAPFEHHPAFHFMQNDIRDAESLEQVLPDRYDTIIHLAAKAGVRPSIKDPLGYQSTNVVGTQNLLELARKKSIPQFIFASSSSVYGVNPNVPWREDDHVLLPISPYASTKVSSELMGHVYSHLFGIRFIALRFFTVYGPRQRPDLAIRKFASLMLRGEPIPVFGDGSTRRDYTYIDDIVEGVMAATMYSGSPYEVFNLGNNRTVSLNEMIEELERALGVQARISRESEQSGDVPQTCADISKAGSLLGYQPNTGFSAGIANFAKWMVKEPYAAGRLVQQAHAEQK